MNGVIDKPVFTDRFGEHDHEANAASAAFSRLPKPLYKTPHGGLYPVPFAKPLILCIEDDAIALTLRKAFLEDNGYNVIGTGSTQQALETLRETPCVAQSPITCCMGKAESKSPSR